MKINKLSGCFSNNEGKTYIVVSKKISQAFWDWSSIKFYMKKHFVEESSLAKTPHRVKDITQLCDPFFHRWAFVGKKIDDKTEFQDIIKLARWGTHFE